MRYGLYSEQNISFENKVGIVDVSIMKYTLVLYINFHGLVFSWDDDLTIILISEKRYFFKN